jgi:23S rRNA pseudouridine955/2504/2580 synthase
LVKVNRAGKASLTRFRPLAITPLASLVEAQLFTGRTHQVRVHATHINYPIAGDPKYGDEEFNRIMREHGLKRLFLHAWRLEFILEDPRQTISVTAPLDLSLQQVLQRLGMAFDQARLSHA